MIGRRCTTTGCDFLVKKSGQPYCLACLLDKGMTSTSARLSNAERVALGLAPRRGRPPGTPSRHEGWSRNCVHRRCVSCACACHQEAA